MLEKTLRYAKGNIAHDATYLREKKFYRIVYITTTSIY